MCAGFSFFFSPPQSTPMETPAFTPRLSPLDCTPSIPDPLIVFASLSSLTTSHFPSLSHPESSDFARRSWTPPPRLELAADATVSPRRHFVVRSPPLVLAHPLSPSFSFLAQPNDGGSDNRISPGFAASPSARRRRTRELQTTSTTPSSSPRRPESRRQLPVVGTSPEPRRRRHPEPPATTVVAINGHRGEAPLSLPLPNQRAARVFAWAGPRLRHLDVTVTSCRGQRPVKLFKSN